MLEEAEFAEEDALNGYIRCRNECDFEQDISITLENVLYGETTFQIEGKDGDCPLVCPKCFEEKSDDSELCAECGCNSCEKTPVGEDENDELWCLDCLPEEAILNTDGTITLEPEEEEL